MEDQINTLAKKAAEATESHYAMQFAQAALNLAHAMRIVADVKEELLQK